MSHIRTRQRYALLLVVALLMALSPPAAAAEPGPLFVIGVPEPAAPESEGSDEFDSLTWRASESCIVDAAGSQDRFFPAALYHPECSPDARGVSELIITFSVVEPCSLVLRLARYGAETDSVEFDGEMLAAAGPGEETWGEVTLPLGPVAAGNHSLRFTVAPGAGDGLHFWDAITVEVAPPVAEVTWLPPLAIRGKVHSCHGSLPVKFALGAAGAGQHKVEVLITETRSGTATCLAATRCETGGCWLAHFRPAAPGEHTALVLLDGAPAGDAIRFLVAGGDGGAAKLKKKR